MNQYINKKVIKTMNWLTKANGKLLMIVLAKG